METQYARLLAVGWFHAYRQGLDLDLAEDCAIDFVLKMLPFSVLFEHSNKIENAAWTHRCAKNFAKNYRRNAERLYRHEFVCSLFFQTNTLSETAEDQNPSHNPQSVILQHEFWQQLTVAVDLLCPRQKSCFLRHHVRGETIKEIAAAYHCTEHSIEQALLRARQRLRDLLARQECDEATLREYLLPPSSE